MSIEERTDSKGGYSSKCRAGNHSSCKTLRLSCTCSCHGGRYEKNPEPIEERHMPAPLKSVDEAPPAGMVWEDPPQRGGQLRIFLTPSVVAELEDNPDRWARVTTFDGKSSAVSAAKKLRTLGQPGIEKDKFEFLGRHHGTGSALYVRYIGK